MRGLVLVLAWLSYTAGAGEVQPAPTEEEVLSKSREKPRLDLKSKAAFNPSLSGARFKQGVQQRSPAPLLQAYKGKKPGGPTLESRGATAAQKEEYKRGAKFARMRRSADSNEIERLLDQLRPLEVEEYNKGIRALGKIFDAEGALKLLKEMKAEGKKPDLYSFNSAMAACGDDEESCLGLFDEMKNDGLKPNVTSFNTALLACKKAKRWERALSLFEDLKEDAELEPDEVSFKTIILACANSGANEHAKSLLTDMRKAGFKNMKINLDPRADTERRQKFATLLQTTDVEEIRSLLEELRPLEVKEYNIGIGAYARAQDKEGALELLKEMQANEGTKPDVITFNSVMAAHRGDADSTLGFFESMREQGVRPDVISYNTAISACKIAGQWERAATLLEDMRKDGVIPDSVSYNSVLAAFEQAGAWEAAVDLLEEMRMMLVERDLISYNIALATCKQAGKWEQASSLLEEMREAGLIPDVISYNTAIAACSPDGQWEHALFLLHQMKEKHMLPDAITYSSATTACEKAGQTQCAMSLLKEMQKVL